MGAPLNRLSIPMSRLVRLFGWPARLDPTVADAARYSPPSGPDDEYWTVTEAAKAQSRTYRLASGKPVVVADFTIVQSIWGANFGLPAPLEPSVKGRDIRVQTWNLL